MAAISPQSYESAATACYDLSKKFQTVYETPQTVLLETNGMAGGYEAVKSWSKAYNDRAAALTMVATNFARALQRYGDILTASSYNWKYGEYTANRDPNKGTPPSLPTGIPTELPYGAGTVVGIASSGAYTNGLQTDWTELQNKVTIFVNGGQVPDGDTDKLARAASMWKTFANSDPLEYGVARLLNVASGLQQGFEAKVPDDIPNHIENLRKLAHKLREIRTAADDIANAVEAHSTALTTMRTEINTQFAAVVVVTAISIGRSTINVKEQPAKEKAPSKQQQSPNDNNVEIDIDFLNDAAWAIAGPANTFLTTLSTIAFATTEVTNGELLTITELPIVITASDPDQRGDENTATKPTGTLGGKPTGSPTYINPNEKDPNNIRSLTRENESASILAGNGYQVEQNPSVPGDKNPDYKIEGKVFDCYAPSTGNVRNIAGVIDGKVSSGQTERIVLNLSDSTASPEDISNQLKQWPVQGLQEVLVIDQSGNVVPVFP
ncbi:hypothetical protein [Nocardia ignorata]|uniref:tRNA nuclease CdiA C-terminal domain-containing protein n=1 Tax=Nocardia ignorata TaxID=145285 RepID=A0A4R6P0B2_NOCIG|nr:hypothetical protein [Nocardia ignorata]TDP30605.1 hypothetical protein DFR75_11169 [Nocardia ignorata]